MAGRGLGVCGGSPPGGGGCGGCCPPPTSAATAVSGGWSRCAAAAEAVLAHEAVHWDPPFDNNRVLKLAGVDGGRGRHCWTAKGRLWLAAAATAAAGGGTAAAAAHCCRGCC